MAYDGIWRSGGTVKTGNFRYFKIADICMDINKKIGNDCIDKMQVLTELGFFYADKFGISLSLEDMMLKPVDPCEKLTDPKLIDLDNKDLTDICEQGLNKASDLKIQIEQDCYDGLISEDDKNDAIMTLYYNGTGDKDSEYMKGVHANVMDTIMDKLSKTQRNNNIFILLDSGARGKADQIMRMCGFLPQLQKDKVSSLKTPVTHNFLNGLSSFDVHMTSYSVKQGLASTQNETPQAGYAILKRDDIIDIIGCYQNSTIMQGSLYEFMQARGFNLDRHLVESLEKSPLVNLDDIINDFGEESAVEIHNAISEFRDAQDEPSYWEQADLQKYVRTSWDKSASVAASISAVLFIASIFIFLLKLPGLGIIFAVFGILQARHLALIYKTGLATVFTWLNCASLIFGVIQLIGTLSPNIIEFLQKMLLIQR